MPWPFLPQIPSLRREAAIRLSIYGIHPPDSNKPRSAGIPNQSWPWPFPLTVTCLPVDRPMARFASGNPERAGKEGRSADIPEKSMQWDSPPMGPPLCRQGRMAPSDFGTALPENHWEHLQGTVGRYGPWPFLRTDLIWPREGEIDQSTFRPLPLPRQKAPESPPAPSFHGMPTWGRPPSPHRMRKLIFLSSLIN